jgi:hypothetical protein
MFGLSHKLFISYSNVVRKRVVVSSGAYWGHNHPLNATLLPINQSIVPCQLIHLLVMAKSRVEVNTQLRCRMMCHKSNENVAENWKWQILLQYG